MRDRRSRRLYRAMLTAWVSAIALACASRTQAQAPTPPTPNPADPVDYIAWVNENFGDERALRTGKIYLQVYEQIGSWARNRAWDPYIEAPWSDVENLSQWLDRNRKPLSRFRRNSAKPTCFFPMEPGESTGEPLVDRALVLIKMPPLLKHANACRGLTANGFRAWADGDHTLLLKNALAIVRSGHQLQGSAILWVRRAGFICAREGRIALLNAANQSDEPGRWAQQVLPKLIQADPPWPGLESTLHLERVMALDLCQRLFAPPNDQNQSPIRRSVYERFNQSLDLPSLRLLDKLRFESTVRAFETSYDTLEKWAGLPYLEAIDSPQRPTIVSRRAKNALVHRFLANLESARTRLAQATAARRGGHLALRLLAHQRVNGQLPDSLDEIQSDDLAEIRIDPFSGQDMVYRRQGDAFVLYSVSANRQDDQGRHEPRGDDGDHVFWPPPD